MTLVKGSQASEPMNEDGNVWVCVGLFQSSSDKLIANWKPIDDIGAILINDRDSFLLGHRLGQQPATPMRPRAKGAEMANY
jgi:hypothetical protein